jgi:tetratricopeptide (TPR) repeat protein
MAGMFLLGLSVYAYLPIRSLSDPAIDWGNPENLRNFYWVVSAKQYSPNLLAMNLNIYAISERLLMKGRDFLHQLTLVGCALAIIGLFVLGRRKGSFVIFSFLVIGILFYTGLNSAFISAYFVPAFALIAVWIGVGLHQAFRWVRALSLRIKPAALGATVRTVMCGALAVSFVLPLGAHFEDMDRSAHTYALRYGKQMLDDLPEGAALFTTDGNALFVLWYLKYCEHERPDLMILEPTWLRGNDPLRSQILEQHPELVIPSAETVARYTDRATDWRSAKFLVMQSVLDANSALRPVFWGMVPKDLPFMQHLSPQGPIFRYSSRPVILDEDVLLRNREFWERERDVVITDPAMLEDELAGKIYPVELNNQGMMFEKLERDDLARWAFELALEFNPEYPVSRYNLGRLEARENNYEKAVEEYQHAVRGNPYMAVAYYNLGNAYRSLGRYDDAFVAYKRAVGMYKQYHEALTAMGSLYLLIERNEEAVEKFRQALDIEPTYVFAWRGLASAYVQMGRLGEAKEFLDRALEMEPESAPALLTLAKYHVGMGNREKAMHALIRSIEIGGDAYLETALSDERLKELADDLRMEKGRPELSTGRPGK